VVAASTMILFFRYKPLSELVGEAPREVKLAA
jgi:hypothetical protein